MSKLFILRHGPTIWNGEKRLQGHRDIALSPEGIDCVKSWSLPDFAQNWSVLVSPLSRARQTAELLGLHPSIDPRLIEMSFGDWEGERLDHLRQKFGQEMIDNEARGLDFCAPNGESPRQVQDRLRPVLKDLAQKGQDHIVVAHNGVIRALYALASGWDMTGKPPTKLKKLHAHLFCLSPQGVPTIDRLNIPLEVPA